MILLTNSKPNVIGLEGYGLHIDGWEPVTDTKAKNKG
jgi:GTP cyclohydrolase II